MGTAIIPPFQSCIFVHSCTWSGFALSIRVSFSSWNTLAIGNAYRACGEHIVFAPPSPVNVVTARLESPEPI
ncbi:hypothetical protein CBS147332_8607 [Penicillium roqueforti]|nr:hypothetical protein CBS147332_8607 [Penicillium roqueforti]KAI3110891.1 hypothetical protein CBS147331_4867 [Penicillium roqueforti]